MNIEISRDENNIVTLRINRPEKRNALDFKTIHDLIEQLLLIKKDSKVRGVIITGEGSVFSAGGDISDMPHRFGKAMSTKTRLDLGLNEIVRLIRSIPRPFIAAVNGACYGAGLVIATACDIIYANNSAKFGFSHANIGLIPEATYYLARTLGLHKSKELVFLRKNLSAQEMLKLGLVNDIFSDDEFMTIVNQIMTKIIHGPVETLGMAKEVLNSAFETNIDTQLQIEALAQGAAFTTEEHKEGVDAFFAKRKPNFIDIEK